MKFFMEGLVHENVNVRVPVPEGFGDPQSCAGFPRVRSRGARVGQGGGFAAPSAAPPIEKPLDRIATVEGSQEARAKGLHV